MSNYVEEIRLRLLPSRVISRKINLKQRTTSEFIGLCPFHSEKTPSFTVNDDKRFFHCFGCSESGDVISFLSKIEGLSYKDAAIKLAGELGIEIEKISSSEQYRREITNNYLKIYDYAANYYQQMLFKDIGKKALEYLVKRGLSTEVIKKFRLGYAPNDPTQMIEGMKKLFPLKTILDSRVVIKSNFDDKLYSLFKNRIMFPILDIKKQVIAFGGRGLDQDAKPKYINSTDNPLFKKGSQLYNLCFALEGKDKNDPLVVVEGYMDVISLYKNGIKNVVAPLGTAFKNTQLKLIWNYCSDPILLFDNDNAGRIATQKIVYNSIEMLASNKTLRIATFGHYKDPDEMVTAKGKKALELVLSEAKAVSKFIFDTELQAKPTETPEQKSELKKRLDEIAGKITEQDLKRYYKDFFFTSFRDAFFKKSFTKHQPSNIPIKASTSAILEVMGHNKSTSRDLIATLIHYPALLANNSIWERFDNIELNDPKLIQIRNELLNNFEDIVSISPSPNEKQRLFDQMRVLICDNFKEYKNFNSMGSSIKNIEEATVYAIRLLDLIDLDSLGMQIQILSNDIMISANADDFTRLSSLKRIYDNLKFELGIV